MYDGDTHDTDSDWTAQILYLNMIIALVKINASVKK